MCLCEQRFTCICHILHVLQLFTEEIIYIHLSTIQITRGEMFYSPNSVEQALDTRLIM